MKSTNEIAVGLRGDFMYLDTDSIMDLSFFNLCTFDFFFSFLGAETLQFVCNGADGTC